MVGSDNAVVYNQETFDRLVEENKRCYHEKMSKIEHLVERMRKEIVLIWDELGFVDEDKADFIQFMDKGNLFKNSIVQSFHFSEK